MSYFLQIRNVFLNENLLMISQPILILTFQNDNFKIFAKLCNTSVTHFQFIHKKEKIQTISQNLLQIVYNENVKTIKFQIIYYLAQTYSSQIQRKYFVGEVNYYEIQKSLIVNENLEKSIRLQLLQTDIQSNKNWNNILIKANEHQNSKALKQDLKDLEDLQIAKLKFQKSPQLIIKISYNPHMKYLGQAQLISSNIETSFQSFQTNNSEYKKSSQLKRQTNLKDFQQNLINIQNTLSHMTSKIENKFMQNPCIDQEQFEKQLNQNSQKTNLQQKKSKIFNQNIINQNISQSLKKEKEDVSINSIHLLPSIWIDSEQQLQKQQNVKKINHQKQILQKIQIQETENQIKSEPNQKQNQINELLQQINQQKNDQELQNMFANKKRKKIFQKDQANFNHIKIDYSSPIYKQITDMYSACCNVVPDTNLEKVLNQFSQLSQPHHQ